VSSVFLVSKGNKFIYDHVPIIKYCRFKTYWYQIAETNNFVNVCKKLWTISDVEVKTIRFFCNPESFWNQSEILSETTKVSSMLTLQNMAGGPVLSNSMMNIVILNCKHKNLTAINMCSCVLTSLWRLRSDAF